MVTLNDLFNCVGWQATNRIGILTEMHNVLQQNYLELKDLFVQIHNDIDISKKVCKEAYNHLPQRIFNFLASSFAFIEHTREMMSFYKGTKIFSQYNEKVKETFVENECAQFIKKLRNYQTHYQIIYPEPVRSLDDNKSWDVILLSEDLMKHPEMWNVKTKNFIERCGKEINLDKTFSEYINVINSFYMWLYNELMRYHCDDFKEEKEIEKQLNIDTDALKAELSKILN